jgi:hypothetical protein
MGFPCDVQLKGQVRHVGWLSSPGEVLESPKRLLDPTLKALDVVWVCKSVFALSSLMNYRLNSRRKDADARQVRHDVGPYF